ncbi:hypothetical protein FOZ60_006568 [Perkinsus olseni]|uniref:Legumain n=1 Tax=Perkinsus olseni TaxID=32597 RepID=A0A7J6NPA5_PEROL|nr:hypothetical protein FOZ60_006568 [Perkinsus olseni]
MCFFDISGDSPGHNVRENCRVSYRGPQVTVDHFEAVLLGNLSGVPPGHPVLDSTLNDFVFLNIIAHGTATWMEFPDDGQLTKKRLRRILEQAKSRGKFKRMVVYVEACESGGMFEGLNEIPGIYVLTAANSKESSWATYCPWLFSQDHKNHDVVGGTEIGTCLGDLFSVNWMEDSDLHRILDIPEKLIQQAQIVTFETNLSHVTQFGDRSVAQLEVTDFQGTTDGVVAKPSWLQTTGEDQVREILGRVGEVDPNKAEEYGRLSELKKVSSVPASYAAIYSAYARLMREAAGPRNHASELRAAQVLLQALQERIRRLEGRVKERGE